MLIRFLLIVCFFSTSVSAKLGWGPDECQKSFGNSKSKKVSGEFSSRIYDVNGLKLQYTFYKNKAVLIVVQKKVGTFNETSAFKVSRLLISKKVDWKQDIKVKELYQSDNYFLMFKSKTVTLSIRKMPDDIYEHLPKLNNDE